MSCKSNDVNSAVLSGVALVLVGVLLLLSQMGIIHDWFNFWQRLSFLLG